MTTETVHGLKETNEIIDGAVEGFKAGKALRDILKDGVDTNDVLPTIALVQDQLTKLNIYIEAVKDAKLAIQEIENASNEQRIAILIKLVKAIEEVEKA